MAWTRFPIAGLDAIAARFGATAIVSARNLYTLEGELATLLALDCHGVELALGLVYGDDTIDALLMASPEQVEAAVRAHRLELGARPRRFAHTAPSGWRAQIEPHTAIYSVAGARVVVHPTTTDDVEQAWQAFTSAIRQHVVLAPGFESRTITVGTMRGVLREVDARLPSGESVRYGFAALSDGRVSYPVSMIATATAAGELESRRRGFAQLVASIVPLPAPSSESVDVFNHWL
jgi:hypothetical protein